MRENPVARECLLRGEFSTTYVGGTEDIASAGLGFALANGNWQAYTVDGRTLCNFFESFPYLARFGGYMKFYEISASSTCMGYDMKVNMPRTIPAYGQPRIVSDTTTHAPWDLAQAIRDRIYADQIPPGYLSERP